MSSTATVQRLQLRVPERTAAAAVLRELQTAALQTWLNGLPLANTTQAAHQLLEQLRRCNRTVLSAPLRFSASEILRPPVDGLIDTLKSHYLGAALPLSPRNRAHAVIVHALLEELAYAYKIILIDLLSATARGPAEQQMLLHALPLAVHYLGLMVLGNYLLHETEPTAIWGELHRLYAYAEQHLNPGERTDHDGQQDSAQHLVTQAYLRIVLLALANPYHLMPGESDTVHRELRAWSALCTLHTPPANSDLAGRFIVDLASEAAPCFCSAANSATPAQARLIDLHELIESLAQQIKKIVPSRDPDSGEELPVKLSERLRRDRLLRLKSAWGGRVDRLIPRARRQARVYTCIGLSACHYFISGEALFQPERDEVLLHRSDIPTGTPSMLSLVPIDIQPWKVQEESERLERGVHQPRVSQFDVESPELDIWRKINSTSAEPGKERFETASDTKVLRLKNFGTGGLCLVSDAQSKVQTRVGELLAYKSEAEPEAEWRVGTLRWLRCQAEDALEIGVMRLTEDASAVAVRAIAGVGTGGEYLRALLAGSDAAPKPEAETLLVPAAMYDIGSILVINSGTSLRYVCLSQLIATSTSFSQFNFVTALPTDSELGKIASIKSLRL